MFEFDSPDGPGASDGDGGSGGSFGAGLDSPAASASKRDDDDSSGGSRRKKRGGRGRRRSSRSKSDESPDADAPSSEADAPADAPAEASDADPGDRADAESGEGKPARKRSRRGRRGGRGSRRKSSDPADGDDELGEAEDARADDGPEARSDDDDTSESGEPRRRRRSRGSRGGRGRKRAERAVAIEVIPGEDDELPELAELPDDAVLVDEGDDGGKGSRSRRKSKKKASSDADDGKGRGKKKASKKRKSAKDDGEGSSRSKRTRRKRGAADDEPVEEPATVERTQKILVNCHDTREERVAVVDDGRIVDLNLVVDRFQSLVNDIYRGRIVNIEPAIGAAFVDFGQGRNGFLHASDVMAVYGDKDWSLDKLLTTQVDLEEWDDGQSKPGVGAELADDEEADDGDDADDGDGKSRSKRRGSKRSKSAKKTRSSKVAKADAGGEKSKSDDSSGSRGKAQRRRGRSRLGINDLLKKGQMVVVQITKDAIGDKGPTLTTFISIPGRYLVLMPSLARTGVSRKIDDDKERRRLKRILQSLNIPEGMGVIVRTAGVGKTKTELRRDLEYLLAAWGDLHKRLEHGRGPASLYRESDAAIRTMRDLFNAQTDLVVVDDEEVHEKLVNFTDRLMPEHSERIVLHDAPRPIFHHYGVEQDFERIFQRRVELPSGGSIVIDQTEALVAIDVNSGRTREDNADFEDIALKTNLEAAPEIARQIRLRDLGGIIVLDFIDMLRAGSRRAVEKALREAMSSDRARSKLGRISQFGLLELTRQRLGPGLQKLLYDTCAHCRGTGFKRSAESRGQGILRRLGSALTLKGFTKVEVRSQPEVIAYLRRNCLAQLKRLEAHHKRELVLTEVPDQLEDSVLRYMRADGREVRPGGRRKR